MLEKIVERLISVKSFVTLLLAVIFSILALEGYISGQEFLGVFTTIIAFYFGTVTEKRNIQKESEEEHK